MIKEKVLVVDDEINIRELIKYNLMGAGYDVVDVETGEEALEVCKKEPICLVLLDLMLPGIDGLDVCKQLKNNEKTKDIPIIMLTAKSEEFDKVLGLELGADDYITKPFGVRELTARVKTCLRRLKKNEISKEVAKNGTRDNVIEVADLTINTETYEVFQRGEQIKLALKEFELLRLLAANKGKVYTRDFLLDSIWGYDYVGETRTIDVHVRHLRKKLQENDTISYIETVRGVGYKFNYQSK
jgi:two-component system alkaline phosphatase synthesis response regulator PhoP